MDFPGTRIGMLAVLLAAAPAQVTQAAPPALGAQIQQSNVSSPLTIHEIRGTEDRNNPLRQALTTPFSGGELFVTFTLRYPAVSIDTPEEDQSRRMALQLSQLQSGFGQSKPSQQENNRFAQESRLRSLCIGPMTADRLEELQGRLQLSLNRLLRM